jgi:hypothetical protein
MCGCMRWGRMGDNAALAGYEIGPPEDCRE